MPISVYDMSNFCILRQGRGLLVTLAITGLFLACNGGILNPQNGATAYKVGGLLAVDHNNNKTTGAAAFTNDTLIVSTGTVKFSGAVFAFNNAQFALDSVYATIWNSAAQFASGNHTFTVSDSTRLSQQSIQTSLPGTVSIIGVTPPNRISNGSDLVKLDWFGGTGASGFVIAAVLKSQAYTGAGYSIYATSQTSETFPREAFYQSNPTTPDTGWYYLYVYAYTGSPDRILSTYPLPVKMPTQLADNIALHDLSGHFGTVRVAIRDSMHVVLQ
jgi:hypothetical protein